ncbi:hypothetical protein O6H91_01G085200 [Diphasiastrum complanatum]|uniref:Uncharacterized protein n=1 Tax=Diphasiastrum complanatum TaxID=34168 RepID=A0ACC2ESY5_DIPCM|nr:hypothetical protein O6H91_Y297100 [Diphasiastrum complanatum]KAJ7294446.1 hypothetical protein O6H91_Y256700 [Diphasiastrum complanatum]KAJ7569591.1 hypothetical protein O6H91_01G085200 [Diphasiastrum complanatum]
MSVIALWMICILGTSPAFAHEFAWPESCPREGGPDCQKLAKQNDKGSVLSVLEYGAKGDGKTDDTQAFTQAWTAACKNGSTLAIPQGQSFLLSPATFKGPCSSKMTLQIAGEIIAPSDPSIWGKDTRTWLVFSRINALTIAGGGTIDGQGQNWWAKSCKVNRNNPCTKAPTALTVKHSTNVLVQDISIKNAQQMHLHFDRSNGVTASRITITSPESSPNTDGIHISNAETVVIESSTMGSGDDCISISSGTSGLQIKDINCGPGHGISIGSLGKYGAYGHVSNVVVDGVTFDGTSNGVRIKTWQGGQGSVTNIQYQNVKMTDVENPILIDQFYCDSQRPCKNQTSAVQLSDISYTNIQGTSAGPVAVKFACSQTVPCTGITLDNVDLQYGSSPGSTTSFCENAKGKAIGTVTPTSCLQ